MRCSGCTSESGAWCRGLFLDTSGPSPIDIGQLKGSKGDVGKGRDEGKFKGERGKSGKDKTGKGSNKKGGKKGGKPEPFKGECDYCGNWGHKRADCRKRLAAVGVGTGTVSGKGSAAQ